MCAGQATEFTVGARLHATVRSRTAACGMWRSPASGLLHVQRRRVTLGLDPRLRLPKRAFP